MGHFLVDGAPGLALLLSLGMVGVGVLRRSRLGLTRLECVAYGAPAGIVATSLVMLGLACLIGQLSATLVIVCSTASIAVGIWLCRPAVSWRSPASWSARGAKSLPVLLFVVVALYQAHFWSRAMRFEEGLLVTHQQNFWGDWGMHLGDVTSFLWGDNFPPPPWQPWACTRSWQ